MAEERERFETFQREERERVEREERERLAREEAERNRPPARPRTTRAAGAPAAPAPTPAEVTPPQPSLRPRPAREPINPENLPPEAIFVENAKNPFKEAFIDGGIDAPEQEFVVWNLDEVCLQARVVFGERGLDGWSQALVGLEGKLSNLSPEKRQIIEAEIKEGAIPIIMPGKQVQLDTTLEQIKKLRPKFKKEGGQIKVANESYLEWEYLKQLIARKNELLVSDIPEEPYILLTRPTQKSEFRELTVEQQIKAIADLSEERVRAGRAPVYAMNMHEYGATQTMFSEMIDKMNGNESLDLTQIRPLDHNATTWTRFVSLPLSVPGGLVPYGDWISLNERLHLGRGLTYANEWAGVRLSVRILI